MRNKPPTPEPDILGKILRYGYGLTTGDCSRCYGTGWLDVFGGDWTNDATPCPDCNAEDNIDPNADTV